MEYQIHQLSNGIRLIHQHNNSPLAYCGLIINAGSRDELENEQGMAHFIEHVLFKGTRKRKSHHIINRLEDVGGELNAYTTKEETCIYAGFLKEHYERSLELISDIAFNSIFPEKELQKEKEVIVDEINSYKDSPAESIFDDFEAYLYPDNSLGKNILGTAETLAGFTKHDILNFIARNYKTNQMIISSNGAIDFKKLVRLVEKHFAKIETQNGTLNRNGIYAPQNFNIRLQKNTFQTHCIMGTLAFPIKDKRRAQLILLNNLLGGNGMNSRLNMALREKNGYAYNAESNYTSFSDTGYLSIYFGTDKKYLDNCIKLIHKEFKQLREKKLGVLQLKKAKSQLIGQLALSLESRESLMLGTAKTLLHFDKIESINEIHTKIEAITDVQIIEVANELLNENNMINLIYE